MSQLLINSISLISRLCGSLVYPSSTKISLLSCIVYTVNVIQTLQMTILIILFFTPDEKIFHFTSKKNSSAIRILDLESNVVASVRSASVIIYQLIILIEFWRQKNLISKIITETKIILKTHQRRSILSLKDYYQIIIYPILIIVRLTVIVSVDFFTNFDSISFVLFRFFMLWANMVTISTEVQFAALASIVETALIDINQRIEEFAVEVVDDYLADCHLGENYLHPFFQYQEIIPSLPINIRSSLINFQLNKRSPNQGTSRAAYEQYSDSMGGLNCQLLPPREEIRNRRDDEVFDPFLDSLRNPGAFKAIEEEKQPARNQFATESEPVPLHLLNLHLRRLRLRLRLRLSGKISPPKTKLRDMKSIRITVGSKGRNPHLEKVEGLRKRCEMRELTKQHSRVARLAADLSTSFKNQLATSQLYIKTCCPLNLYLLFRYFKLTSTLRQTINIWHVPLIILVQFIRIFIIYEKGQSVILQDEKTRKNLLALSRGRVSPELVREVEAFLTQVELSPIEFKAGLNTRVDMAQFVSIIISVLTSLIILTQFSGLL